MTFISTGFAAASKHHINPAIDVIIPETQNNTLNNYCPNAEDGTRERDEWLNVFAPPIVERLQKLAPGAKVTTHDIHRLLALCPFETVAFERPSPFCELFTDEEFRAMEYYGDVEKYYKTGCVASQCPSTLTRNTDTDLHSATETPSAQSKAWDTSTSSSPD